jgi:hypothetical protein
MQARLLTPLLLAASTLAQTYTLTNFGTPCAGALQGQIVTLPAGTGLRLGVHNAPANAFAILVAGHPQPGPIALPGTQCVLLVDPRFTMAALTNSNGNVQFAFRIPPVLPISVDFQTIVLGFTTTGLIAGSTNGVHLVGV